MVSEVGVYTVTDDPCDRAPGIGLPEGEGAKVEGDSLGTEGCLKRTVAGQVLRCPDYNVGVVPGYPQSVGVTHHRLDVVAAHHHGDVARRAYLAQHAEQGDPSRWVEERGRLVEQQYGRLLGQRPGHHHPLTLTVRQLTDEGVGQIGSAHRRQRLVDDRMVMGPQPPTDARMWMAPQRDDVAAGEPGHRHPVGQHGREGLGDLTARHPGRRGAVDLHLAGKARLQSSDRAQQGGLSGTVGPHEPNHLPGNHRTRHPRQHPRDVAARTVPDRQVRQCETGHVASASRYQRMRMTMTTGAPKTALTALTGSTSSPGSCARMSAINARELPVRMHPGSR